MTDDILISQDEIETDPFRAYVTALIALFEQTHQHLSPSESLVFDLSITDRHGNHTLLNSTISRDFVKSEVN